MTAVSHEQLRGYREGLFFIVGNSRGGTTLLQAMLNSHPGMTIPPETHFFYRVKRLGRRFRAPVGDVVLEPLVDLLLAPGSRFAEFGLDAEHVIATFRRTDRTHEDLFLVLLACYAAQRGKPRCGEKTPRHLLKVEEIARTFPRSRFISIFRDPRAVASSELNARFGSPSVFITARRWARYIDMHLRLTGLLPRERYLMIQYEELVQEPEPVLRRVCAFLEEDYHPSMLEFHARSESEKGYPASETWKHKTMRPLDPSRLDDWRMRLTPQQIAIIERKVGWRLAEMDYRPVDTEPIGALEYHVHLVRDCMLSVVATVTRSRN